mgnify:CR=1 FL=1
MATDTMKPCELCCRVVTSGMRYSKRAACFKCIDKLLEFAITAGMSYKGDTE